MTLIIWIGYALFLLWATLTYGPYILLWAAVGLTAGWGLSALINYFR